VANLVSVDYFTKGGRGLDDSCLVSKEGGVMVFAFQIEFG